MEPSHAIFRILLNPRLQLRLVQIEIVHSPDPRYAHPRETRAAAVHKRAAFAAEVVCHGVARGDGFGLGELGEQVLAGEVREGAVFDDEVGGEH